MNPELRRNLWLELSAHRLILVPAVIFGVAFVARAMLPTLALFGFILVAIFWGARQAAFAVIEEARERTWDIQRMSSMDPWAMTWGKLLGSTSIAWYGGTICLAVYLGGGSAGDLDERLMLAGIVVFGAILAQTSAMTAGLLGMRLHRRISSRFSNALLIVVLIAVLVNVQDVFDTSEEILWYGIVADRLTLVLCSIAVFAAWGLTGAYRAMCTELQVRTTPWLWISFAVFIGLYTTGFSRGFELTPSNVAIAAVSNGAFSAIVLSYVAAFSAPRDPIGIRRVLRSIRDGNNKRALEEIPLWFSSAMLALALSLVSLAVGSAPYLSNERLDNLGPGALALAFMMLRDVALLTYFGFSSPARRTTATALIYIVTLDFLIPPILKLAGLDLLASIVMPWPAMYDNPYFAVIVFGVHLAIAGTLAVRAYRAALPNLN
jgi:hypothetical protein